MSDKKIEAIVDQTIVQATGEIEGDFVGGTAFSWLVGASDTLPPWWSKQRDSVLSRVWKEGNHLSTAIYNTQSKMVGIPFSVHPLDTGNDQHYEEAETIEYVLKTASGFGAGWVAEYSKFIEDLLTQDNGAFFEILGEGSPDGPIIGRPLAVRHLDSFRCQRTGSKEFPVLYTGDDGKLYKLHRTRVIFTSQMPSPRKEMLGVGLCAVSRCIEVATTLADMVRYKQERLGSRPHNQIIVGKGITGKTIMTALRMAEEQQNNAGYRRYGRTVAVGSESPDIDLEVKDMTHMEPFNEEIATNYGVFLIAAALGMDADEIWPTSGRSGGGSKGDANLRRMRSRGRLPAQLTSELAMQFNYKFLPPHLRMSFDYQDDEQDQQTAVIRDIRGRNRERDISTGTVNIQIARKNMMLDGDIDKHSFQLMELDDGRLPSGAPVSTLFFDRSDPVYVRLLRFMENPLRFTANITGDDGMVDDTKVDIVLDTIQTQREIILDELVNSKSARLSERINYAYHAIDWLEEQYRFAAGMILPEVPMAQRRLRADIRVVPDEVSPVGESPAQAAQGSAENVSAND